MTPDQFLASIEQEKARREALPDPTEEFAKTQFKSVVDAVAAANRALLAYMKSNQVAPVTSVSTPDVAEVTKAVKALETALQPLKQDNSDVVAAINALQLSPTYKPEINVSPTPVTVKAPVVTVAAPDLKPITKAIKDNKPAEVDLKPLIAAVKDVSKQVIMKPTPVANTPTDPLIQYAEADIDDVDATNALKTIRYYGYTNTSGAWYIRRLDATNIGTSGKTVRIVQGIGNYATSWTNRASLTYVTWGS